MISNFTIAELDKVHKKVETPAHLQQYEHDQPRWRVTGESGAQNLYFYGAYVCWLKDFKHFQKLWKLLNVKPT
jgi:hypothetical protein